MMKVLIDEIKNSGVEEQKQILHMAQLIYQLRNDDNKDEKIREALKECLGS